MAPFDDVVGERELRELHEGVENLLREDADARASETPPSLALWGNVGAALAAIVASILAATVPRADAAGAAVAAAAGALGAVTAVAALARGALRRGASPPAVLPRAALRPVAVVATALGLVIAAAGAFAVARPEHRHPVQTAAPVTHDRPSVSYRNCYMKPVGRPECRA